MAPIVVDPHLLTGAGGAVGGVGDELAAAVGTLGSALAGCGAMAGHDTAGLAFGKSYEQAAQSLLNAVDAAVNACRKTGFGVSMSATNYSRAEAASTVGGGEALPVPGDPQAFEAPRVPSPFGSGVAAPLAWALVESFVGSVWPDGDPTQLRVAAGAWRAFGLTIRGVAGQLNGPLGVISGQQVPEGPAMTSALSQIGAGTSQAADECAKLATQLDEFAADVQSAQDAIRDLLHRLSTPGGLFHEVVAVFKGDAFEEIKKIAEDIKAVLHNLKRQATAREQLVQQAMATLDGAVLGFEAHMRKEFIHYLGEDVGSRVSVVFDLNVDIVEGVGKGAVGFGDMITQLNPGRFAYDPQGAGATWKGLVDTGLRTNPFLAPLHPQETLQANKELLKGLVHADDWRGDRPGLGAGETLFDIATLATPGAGAAGAGAKGAELAGGAARGFKAGGEAADAAGAAGRAGARAGEAAGAARGFTSVTEESGKLATSLNKVGDDVVAGAQSGRLPSATPAPVLDHAPTPAGPAAEARVAPHAPAPVGDHPTVGGMHEPAPAASAPHPGGAPGEQLPGSGAGHTPQSAAPHTSLDGHPSEPTLTTAHPPQGTPISPAHEPSPGGFADGAHPPEPPVPHDPGGPGGGDHSGGGDHGGGGPDTPDHSPTNGGPESIDEPHSSPHGDIPDGQGPVHSDEPSGDGWHRLPDVPGEPHYGKPLEEHWGQDHNPADASQINQDVRNLMHDPDAPFGRDPQGHAYTQHEYAERFNKVGPNGEHWYNYASPDGAAPGSKVAFTDAEQFERYYGTQFDRVGGEDGRYLAVIRDGVPAPWEQRSLHVDSFGQPYHTYSLDELPEGWTIEVSEIEPAVGQPGGALQVRILDDAGVVKTVRELLADGVLQ